MKDLSLHETILLIEELKRAREGWLWSYENSSRKIDELSNQISELQQTVKMFISPNTRED